MQVLDHEDTGIKLTLHVPKEKQANTATASKVEEFLADNREYLDEESKDSEVPDDYDSEEGVESSSDSEASSSSMSSMLVSPGGPEGSLRKQQQYPMEEIDRIIREAKDQKRKLQGLAEESESSMSESGFDKRYLQK